MSVQPCRRVGRIAFHAGVCSGYGWPLLACHSCIRWSALRNTRHPSAPPGGQRLHPSPAACCTTARAADHMTTHSLSLRRTAPVRIGSPATAALPLAVPGLRTGRVDGVPVGHTIGRSRPGRYLSYRLPAPRPLHQTYLQTERHRWMLLLVASMSRTATRQRWVVSKGFQIPVTASPIGGDGS